jgi:FAD/FMN-containing dehydrogenase
MSIGAGAQFFDDILCAAVRRRNQGDEMNQTALQEGNLKELKAGLQGDVVLPRDEGYDSARTIWNSMIDKRPALIARCLNSSDVLRSVNFARDNGLLLAVRGGGHNIAGSALVDGGVVIDLSRMKAVKVDAAAQAHGLATPLGINSTTGVAGLTLGGGFGWLSRKLGMTVDHLESAEVVTAAGDVVRASAIENPDLFWALRGGGGNFGVVTRFEFQLHPIGPNLLSGLIVYPIASAKSVLQQHREFCAKAPDELTVWAIARNAPPLPFLPESAHGKGIVVLAFLYAGDPTQGERLIDPLRKFGAPLGEHVGVQPFVAWQQAFDPLLAPGARNYWKSHNLSSLDDGLIDAAIEYIRKLPSPHCEVLFAAMGGEVSRRPADSTAYAQRDARFIMNVHGRWDGPSDDESCICWSRDFFQASAPFSTGGVYVNFMTADERDRVRAAYGSNYDRLARVKRAYDPKNLFRVNQNIQPA